MRLGPFHLQNSLCIQEKIKLITSHETQILALVYGQNEGKVDILPEAMKQVSVIGEIFGSWSYTEKFWLCPS